MKQASYLCLMLSLVVSAICFLDAPVMAQKTPRTQYKTPSKPDPVHGSGPVGMEADVHFQRLLSNSQVRVFRVNIAGNETTLLNAHPHDYIVISLGSNMLEAVGGDNRFALDMNDGDAQVLTGGWPHKLANKVSQPADLLILEVVHGIAPGQPLCGLGAAQCNDGRFGNTDAGRYSQSTLFETGTIRLLRAELGPGGVLPTHTDATDHLILTTTEASLSDGFNDGSQQSAAHATWSPGRLGRVKNLGTHDARMLIVEFK